MSGVGERVIWSFEPDFLRRGDGKIYGNVEAVRIVLAVGHALDHAVGFAVERYEAAGQTLCWRGEACEVETVLFALLVAEPANTAHDFQTQLLRFLAFAMMVTNQAFERFRQTDEADGQRALFEHLAHLVVRFQRLRALPHALAHQEREVTRLSFALNLEAFEQLVAGLFEHEVQALEEGS